MMKKDIKEELHAFCLNMLDERIESIRKNIDELQTAANEESKSSMGDKYETGRAMMHNERDKYMHQLASFDMMRNSLNKINPESRAANIKIGSLVKSNHGKYFISVALGQVEVDGESFFLISAASPIGQKFFGGKAGDSFSFNGRTYKVEEVL